MTIGLIIWLVISGFQRDLLTFYSQLRDPDQNTTTKSATYWSTICIDRSTSWTPASQVFWRLACLLWLINIDCQLATTIDGSRFPTAAPVAGWRISHCLRISRSQLSIAAGFINSITYVGLLVGPGGLRSRNTTKIKPPSKATESLSLQ